MATSARRRYRGVETAFSTYDRDKRAVGNVLAGAVAFRLFVYLLPLALAIVTLLGIIAGFSPNEPQRLTQSAGLGHTVIDSVATATAASKKSLWALIPLSLYALYSGGTGVLKVLRAVHAVAWGEPVTKVKGGVRAAFTLFLVAAGLIAVVVLLQWIRKQSGGIGLVAVLATTVVIAGAWLLASRALPHGDAPWRALLPGAILVGVGLEILHLVSTYYLGNKIESASEMYGSLGAAAAIIAWLYLIGRLMVASAMLNASAWERQHATQTNGQHLARHHFATPVITLGGDDIAPDRGGTLAHVPSKHEDGKRTHRSERG